MQYLYCKGLLQKKAPFSSICKILDYGCGRGYDVFYFGATLWVDGYDPYWDVWSILPKEKYDVITCNYVLNVVTKEVEIEIIKAIKGLLKDGGKAYFTVRRDIKKDYHVRDYVQRVVRLDLPSLYHCKGKFEIYTLDKN